MKLRKAGVITTIVVLILVIYAAVRLVSIHMQIESARANQQELAQQAEAMETSNAEMEYALENSEDDDVIAACLAHDMVEDSKGRVTLTDLPEGRVREAVRLVSKNEYSQTEKDWMDRYYHDIRENPLACLVKCIDRVNNVAGMADDFSREKMICYLEETDRYYPALLAVIKKETEWNNAWWLLRYQLLTTKEAYKRLLGGRV